MGGEFWTDGYFVSTVGAHSNEDVIRHYIKNQVQLGQYKQLHKQKVVYKQLTVVLTANTPLLAAGIIVRLA